MKLQMNSRYMMWVHAGTFTAVSLFMLASFSVDYARNQGKTAQAISPELYNSAYAPVGKSGGKIIPASCSIGEPSDVADGFAPCPAPQVSINPLSATAVGGGFVNWSYNATNANNCDLSTTMSSTNMGPAYSFIGGAISNTYNAGAFANASGWVRYTVTCWDAPHINSGSNSILITTTLNPKVDVVFSTNGESPFLAINSFTAITYDEISGELSWSVSGATSCTATGPSVWSGSTISRPTGSRFVSYAGSNPTIRHYTLSCTNGTDTLSRTASIVFEGSGGCFVAGTKVAMADGSIRDIETVEKGELIKTSKGPGAIEKLWHISYKGDIYAFNGSGNYFVTDTHPFMTTEGWKSFNPEGSMRETSDITVTLLEIGDTFLKEDGSTVTLNSIDKKYTEQMVYNFKIEGSADYYADGYWVHNAMAKL